MFEAPEITFQRSIRQAKRQPCVMRDGFGQESRQDARAPGRTIALPNKL
jgi:hypothetical protein